MNTTETFKAKLKKRLIDLESQLILTEKKLHDARVAGKDDKRYAKEITAIKNAITHNNKFLRSVKIHTGELQ